MMQWGGKLDTHFARAIRKYGEKCFSVEVICSANTQDELNQLEHQYIHEFDCLDNGYNETDSISRSGGNTYRSKTREELNEIGRKIRSSKLGGLNPASKPTKMIDLVTGEEMIFPSAKDCSNYLELPTHHPVARRASGEVKKLLNDRYDFEYLNKESVSTIGDECSQVGEEIGTSSKRETSQENEKKI